jgi:hypothetical protein
MITSVEIDVSSRFGNKFIEYWESGLEIVHGSRWSSGIMDNFGQIFDQGGGELGWKRGGSKTVISMRAPVKNTPNRYKSGLRSQFDFRVNTSRISKFKRSLKNANLDFDADDFDYLLSDFCEKYSVSEDTQAMTLFVGVLSKSKNKNEYEKLLLSGPEMPGDIKVGYKFITSKTINGRVVAEGSEDQGMLEETYHDEDEFYESYGELWYDEEMLNEAKYQGRTVQLGKPMQGDVAKFKVYVKDPATGNVKKVNFGQKGAKIKKNNPGRRKNFRARHNCDNPGPRTSARYWSCRKW